LHHIIKLTFRQRMFGKKEKLTVRESPNNGVAVFLKENELTRAML